MSAAPTLPADVLVVLHRPGWRAPAALADPGRWPTLPAAPGTPAVPVEQRASGERVTVFWRGAPDASFGAGRGAIASVRPVEARTGPSPGTIAQAGASWRPDGLRGSFRAIAWDDATPSVSAWVDPFRSMSLCWASGPDFVAVASDLRLLLEAGLVAREVSPHALYHYLNFSYVPAPVSAFAGARKIEAGCRLDARPGDARVSRWWTLDYAEDLRGGEDALAAALRERIVGTVHAHRPDEACAWGTFLSGGTDSSSISGILARQRPDEQVRSFSIGFDEAGYDELEYSRIARTHYGLGGAERRVGEHDAMAAIPKLVDAYDEPFGNSSAIPTFHCAAMAREAGVELLIAGDGGDEIFGGNERYRKDVIMGAWYRLPSVVKSLGASVAGALSPLDVRLFNRVRNFVERASLPNPDRFYTDDSFASDVFVELLDARFRALVGRDDSLDVQRRIYGEARARSELNRLMYIDLMMTIADNDLVKVVRAARSAGVGVAFPYLDRELVEYAGRLPASMKVHGLSKRYLFKRAMDDVLPEAIRTKRKQGFGLPVSVWLRESGPFRDMMCDVLGSRAARERGIVRPEFVESLLERHRRGAWDHASELYILMTLELWHRRYVDGS